MSPPPLPTMVSVPLLVDGTVPPEILLVSSRMSLAPFFTSMLSPLVMAVPELSVRLPLSTTMA